VLFHNTTMYNDIMELVNSILCRDGVDTQYMIIQKGFSKFQKAVYL